MTELAKVDDFYPRPGARPCQAAGAPDYFRRWWNAGMGDSFWVFGWSTSSTYEEDRDIERQMWFDRGRFFAVCFSIPFPQPELGFVPIGQVQAISREELEASLALCGWEL